MPKLWALLRGRESQSEKRYSLSEYFTQFAFGGVGYAVGGGGSPMLDREQIENSFTGYVRSAYKSNGIVFACMLTRLMIFGEARFQFQQMIKGRPGDLFDDPALHLLDKPWPNGTTGELLSRAIQDLDLAGNCYVAREGSRLRRLRPDWVDILLTAPPAEDVQSDVAGYLYRPGGGTSTAEPTIYLPEQLAHWSMIPDPEAQYRGMSWITPVIREIQADRGATLHKERFFANAATPNLAVSLKETVTEEQFKAFMAAMNESHRGAENAYKTLYLGGGADVTVVGADFKQIDFKATQGAGETRIAADAGVHPVIVGLSEGMQGSSLNAGNFNSARRLVADKTMRPLWRSVCAAFSPLVKVPPNSRLWFDDRDIAFLREDRKDLADIQSTEAMTIRALVDGGYDPATVTPAVMNQDWSLLVHTGKLSVQLQSPDQAAEDDAPADGAIAPATAPAKSAADAKLITEMVQKVYLGVGKVITADEARQMLNDAGANLDIPGPLAEPEAEPANTDPQNADPTAEEGE